MRISLFGDNKTAVDAVPAAKRFHRAAKRLHRNRPDSAYYKKFIGDDIMIVSRPKHDDILIFAARDNPVEEKKPKYETIPTWETVAKDTGHTEYVGSGVGLLSWTDGSSHNQIGYADADPIANLIIFDYGKKKPYSLEIVIHTEELVSYNAFDMGTTVGLIPTGLGVFKAKRRPARAWGAFRTSSFFNAIYEDYPDYLPNNKDLAFALNEDTGHLVYVEHEGDYEYGEISPRKITSEYIGYESEIISETLYVLNFSGEGSIYEDEYALRKQDKFGADYSRDARFIFAHSNSTHGNPGRIVSYFTSREYFASCCTKKKFIRISDRVIMCANISCSLGPLNNTILEDPYGNVDVTSCVFFCSATYTGSLELIGLRLDGSFTRMTVPVDVTMPGLNSFENGLPILPLGAILRIPNIYEIDTNGVIPEIESRIQASQFPGIKIDLIPSLYKALRFNDLVNYGQLGEMDILGQSYMCINGSKYMFDGYSFVETSPASSAISTITNFFGSSRGEYTHWYNDRSSRGTGHQYVEKHSDDLKLFLVKHTCRVTRDYTVTTTNSGGWTITFPASDYIGFARVFTIHKSSDLEIVWTSTEEGPYNEESSQDINITGYSLTSNIGYIGHNTMYPKIFSSENMRIVVEYLYNGKISAFHIDENFTVTKLLESYELSVEPIFIHHSGKCLALKEKIWISLDAIDDNITTSLPIIAGGVLLDCVDCAGIFYDLTHFVDHISENVFVVKKINFEDGTMSIVDTINNCNYFELSPDSSIAIFLKAFESKDDESYIAESSVYIADFIDRPFCFESTDIRQTMIFEKYLYEPTDGNKIGGGRRKFPYGRRGITICECSARYAGSIDNVIASAGKGLCGQTSIMSHALLLPNEWSAEETTVLSFKKMLDPAELGRQHGSGFPCPFRTEGVGSRFSRRMSASPQVLTGQFSDGFKRRDKHKEFYENKRLNKFIVVSTFSSERVLPEITESTGKPIYTLRRRKDGLNKVESEKFEI